MKDVILPSGTTIKQKKSNQGISSDSAEFINFILENEKEENLHLLDLGTGIGIIPIMIKEKRKQWNITGVDIQENIIKIAKENDKNLNFILADIKEFNPKSKYDLIVSNPPYFKITQGKISPNKERAISRHELFMNMNDLLACIKKNMKLNGRSYIIYPEIRNNELKNKLSKFNFNITNNRFLRFKNEEKNRIMVKIINA